MRFERAMRRPVSGFREGEYSETRACLVQVFRRDPFFEICPECGTRVKQKDGKWSCDDHGQVEPGHAVVLGGVIDDGSGNIRAVFFRELAERVFGKNAEDLRDIAKEKGTDALFDLIRDMGKDFIMRGRVKRNQFTDRPEFVVNEMEEVDVRKECEDLLGGGKP
jgi:hypothetical protein